VQQRSPAELKNHSPESLTLNSPRKEEPEDALTRVSSITRSPRGLTSPRHHLSPRLERTNSGESVKSNGTETSAVPPLSQFEGLDILDEYVKLAAPKSKRASASPPGSSGASKLYSETVVKPSNKVGALSTDAADGQGANTQETVHQDSAQSHITCGAPQAQSMYSFHTPSGATDSAGHRSQEENEVAPDRSKHIALQAHWENLDKQAREQEHSISFLRARSTASEATRPSTAGNEQEMAAPLCSPPPTTPPIPRRTRGG